MKYYTHFIFIIILSIIINLIACDIEDQNNSKITEGKYLLDMDSNVYDENYGDICLKIVYSNKQKTLNMYNTTYLLKR